MTNLESESIQNLCEDLLRYDHAPLKAQAHQLMLEAHALIPQFSASQQAIYALLKHIQQTLKSQIEKEEVLFFPYFVEMKNIFSFFPQFPGSITPSIQAMQAHLQTSSRQLEQLEALIKDDAPTPTHSQACQDWLVNVQAFIQAYKGLIHKENECLFPQILAFEAQHKSQQMSVGH